jgi:hypothetical protein
MTTDRLPKVLLNYKSKGYRNTRRSMARWEDRNRPTAYILEVEEEEIFLPVGTKISAIILIYIKTIHYVRTSCIVEFYNKLL